MSQSIFGNEECFVTSCAPGRRQGRFGLWLQPRDLPDDPVTPADRAEARGRRTRSSASPRTPRTRWASAGPSERRAGVKQQRSVQAAPSLAAMSGQPVASTPTPGLAGLDVVQRPLSKGSGTAEVVSS